MRADNRLASCGAGIIVLVLAGLLPYSGRAGNIGSPITAGGYTFTNFDAPNAGAAVASGTNANGIANNGDLVGFSIGNGGTLSNFVRTPNGSFTSLALDPATGMAFGINDSGTVVGAENGAAFVLPSGGTAQTLNTPAGSLAAFGINDSGNIVGQYAGNGSPGFFILDSAGNGLVTINAPSGPNIVNAQGVNANGLVVGFYVGTDGQDHGFMGNVASQSGGVITGTAIADPTVPNVAGEPGATFVFSQVLGINSSGIAVGYYGDSTTSQHGFLYNVNTGAYTFLDDPSEQFANGVEVTQITGINNSDEITGFYSDSSGVFHGFVACPAGQTCPGTGAVPEPGSLALAGFGLLAVGFHCVRRRWKRAVWSVRVG